VRSFLNWVERAGLAGWVLCSWLGLLFRWEEKASVLPRSTQGRQAYFCGNVLAPAVSLAVIAFDCLAAYAPASLEDSGQLGGAWAHDCAVGDEEVAEDQD
jgi:hypothetical protein